jgi:hypothetical protein
VLADFIILSKLPEYGIEYVVYSENSIVYEFELVVQPKLDMHAE